MSEESLKHLVQELDVQIGKAKSLSSGDRDLLENLRRDIDKVLAQPGKRTGLADRDVLGDLRNATERFESSHPDVSAAMAQILDVFTKLGI
jgi:hypothetical protein